jgi:hypothetical protein
MKLAKHDGPPHHPDCPDGKDCKHASEDYCRQAKLEADHKASCKFGAGCNCFSSNRGVAVNFLQPRGKSTENVKVHQQYVVTEADLRWRAAIEAEKIAEEAAAAQKAKDSAALIEAAKIIVAARQAAAKSNAEPLTKGA